jgi:cytochrome c556
MRKITIFVFALAFSALGLFAQDELAQYQTWMKGAVAARGGAQTAVNANDAAGAAAKFKDMADNFDHIAAFWKSKGKDDAVKFAEGARDAAKAGAESTSIDDQKAALAKAAPNCGGCHAIYRDGTKFKGL